MGTIITDIAVKPSAAPAPSCVLDSDLLSATPSGALHGSARLVDWQTGPVVTGHTAVDVVAGRLRASGYAETSMFPEPGTTGHGHLGATSPVTGFDPSTVADPGSGRPM